MLVSYISSRWNRFSRPHNLDYLFQWLARVFLIEFLNQSRIWLTMPDVPCLLNLGLASSNASRSLEQTVSSEASAQSVIPSQNDDKSTQLTPSEHLKRRKLDYKRLIHERFKGIPGDKFSSKKKRLTKDF